MSRLPRDLPYPKCREKHHEKKAHLVDALLFTLSALIDDERCEVVTDRGRHRPCVVVALDHCLHRHLHRLARDREVRLPVRGRHRRHH